MEYDRPCTGRVATAVAMRRLTLVGVPAMPALTASLTIRRAQVEEAESLATLLGRAYPTEHRDAADTEHELFDDKTVRATLVVAAEGRLIATASLQYILKLQSVVGCVGLPLSGGGVVKAWLELW